MVFACLGPPCPSPRKQCNARLHDTRYKRRLRAVPGRPWTSCAHPGDQKRSSQTKFQAPHCDWANPRALVSGECSPELHLAYPMLRCRQPRVGYAYASWRSGQRMTSVRLHDALLATGRSPEDTVLFFVWFPTSCPLGLLCLRLAAFYWLACSGRLR